MDIHIDKNKKLVKWSVEGKIIIIQNEHTLYAFKHGKNMLMIKERNETLGIGFSAYDTKGRMIFSYKYLGNIISFKEKNFIEIDGKIVSVDYEEEKRKLIILKVSGIKNTLLIYDEKCNFIAELKPPKNYIFIGLKNNDGDIMVVAHGTSDLTRDSYGRNDWNFTIDFDNYYIGKKSIIQ